MQKKRARVEFLLADIESAHAFLDAAERWTGAETVRRNVEHAKKTLALVKWSLAQLESDATLLEKVLKARDKLQSRVDDLAGRC